MGTTHDITKALREKHLQFQTRVKAADKIARARDVEVREHNALLTQRIIELEGNLKQAKESIEALREFVDLLPSVKHEVDSFEYDVEAIEARAADDSHTERIDTVTARVDALENDVREIMTAPSVTDLSDLLSGTMSDFSVVDEPTGDQPHPSLPKPLITLQHDPQDALSLPGITLPPDQSETLTTAPQLNSTIKNCERLELITKLLEWPLKNGDVWFIIPQRWFDDWRKICNEYPDDVNTKIDPMRTSMLVDKWGQLVTEHTLSDHMLYNANVGRKLIPSAAWDQLLGWYGSDSVQFPRLVMPQGVEGLPSLEIQSRVYNLYFLLPPGKPNANPGPYTPKVVAPQSCTVKTLRSIILNSLPAYSRASSIEFFSVYVQVPPEGWYLSDLPKNGRNDTRCEAALLDWQSDQIANMRDSIVVVIKVLDEIKGCMVPIDPILPGACPPSILTWSPSCE